MEQKYDVESKQNNVLFLRFATVMYRGTNLSLFLLKCAPGNSYPLQNFKCLQVLIQVSFATAIKMRQGSPQGKPTIQPSRRLILPDQMCEPSWQAAEASNIVLIIGGEYQKQK